MKQLIVGCLGVFLIASCESSSLRDLSEFFVDVSEFQINDSILKDGDYVDILGSSGNLTKEHQLDAYNLVVVKSVRTGDTVNVLVTNFFQADLNNRRTRFLSNTSELGKLVENVEHSDAFVGKNIKDIEAKSFNKVFYDSEFITVDVRKFPAITGNLGDYEMNIQSLGK